MNLVEAYKQLLENIHHTLKEHGYSRRAGIFYKKNEDNWGVIGFQKSSSSSNEFGIKFTINLGVYSKVVAELLDPTRIKPRPIVWDLHWGQRIGLLFPEKNDKWWVIDESTSMEFLEKEIRECLLHKAIPEIDKCITNNHLIDLGISNQLSGTGLLYRESAAFSPDYKSRLAKLIEKKHEKP
jgi:hypothetical protein